MRCMPHFSPRQGFLCFLETPLGTHKNEFIFLDKDEEFYTSSVKQSRACAIFVALQMLLI